MESKKLATFHKAFDLSFPGLVTGNIYGDLNGRCHISSIGDHEIVFAAVLMIGDLITLF